MDIIKRDLREQIKSLLKDYKITLKTLSKITDIDFNILQDYVNNKINLENLPVLNKAKFANDIFMLSEGIKEIKEDDRIAGVIDVLTIIFEVSYETISIYAGIKLEELQSFMKDTNSISYEKKYKLATASLFLHYLLKKPPEGMKEK